jgi:hypothetical protein
MLAVQTAVSFLSRIAPTLAPDTGTAHRLAGRERGLSLGDDHRRLACRPAAGHVRCCGAMGSMRNLQVGLALGVLGALLSAVPAPAARW